MFSFLHIKMGGVVARTEFARSGNHAGFLYLPDKEEAAFVLMVLFEGYAQIGFNVHT